MKLMQIYTEDSKGYTTDIDNVLFYWVCEVSDIGTAYDAINWAKSSRPGERYFGRNFDLLHIDLK